jgi:phage/plasmid-like protein (TIGR03299 family)
MSYESNDWLNNMTLIGFTEKRGKAWHYRESSQGAEPNHYTGAIPVEDVKRRLFFWEPKTYAAKAGPYTDETTKGVVRPKGTFGPADRGEILSYMSASYPIHGFDQWLIKNPLVIADDSDLQPASAGLLKGGAVAWVQFEMSETLEAAGMAYRPFLTAATSLDGSLKTTYLTGSQAVVCDNTLSAALRHDTETSYAVKHTASSLNKIQDVREALRIVWEVAENFADQVDHLSNVTVNDLAWNQFLEAQFPTTRPDGKPLTGRGLTVATRNQTRLWELWNNDPRVKPWTGTALGVVQAVNTFEHHDKATRGQSIAQRNTLRMVTGGHDDLDRNTMRTLAGVL